MGDRRRSKMLRSIKSLRYSPEENAVRDATKDDDDLTTNPQLFEQIAVYTKDKEKYPKIFQMLYKRLIDYPKINHVHKALILIDYGLDKFCSEFSDDIGAQYPTIQRITKYRYYKNGDKDIAGPVRQRANTIIQKLTEENANERATANVGHVTTKRASMKGVAQPQQQPQRPQYQQIQQPIEAVPSYEEETNTEEQGDFQFEQLSAGIEVTGRNGSNAGRINGIYIDRENPVGGKTSYVREGVMDDPICLWYWEEKSLWMISRQSYIGTDQAYGCTQSTVENPADIPEDCVWRVFDKNVGSYVKDFNIRVNNLVATEEN